MADISSRRHASQWAREAAAIALFALAGFILLSLATYHPLDPSINTAVAPREEIRNAAGIVGAYLADCLAQFLGAASYALAVGLVIAGQAALRRREFASPGGPAVSSVLFAIALAALFQLHPRSADLLPGAPSGGGIAGKFVADLTVRLFNYVGTHLVLGTVAVLTAMAATHLSFYALGASSNQAIKKACRGFRLAAATVADFMAHLLRSSLGRAVRTAGSRVARWRPGRDLEEEQPILEAFRALATTLSETISKPASGTDERATPAIKPSAFLTAGRGYSPPPVSLLDEPPPPSPKKQEDIAAQGRRLEQKLRDFGVDGQIVQVRPGPVVTLFEFQPASGVKVNKIVSLADDLALVMKAESVRMMAPIPGKAAVGIEIPNPQREPVYLREILSSEQFTRSPSKLTLALGKDIFGHPTVTDLTQIPHLLVAGATGSGKSVSVNAMICSILFRASPEEAKLILIDPKRLEFSNYDGIPHLLSPVVTDPKRAAVVLRKVVEEMERRYELLAEHGVRHITTYNALVEREGRPDAGSLEKLPYIVVLIDELADLMMVSSREVEGSLARLAQMARAAGIHLVIATQRPSVDVLTGIIKANFPARLSFQVSSRVDSRTILDTIGAEHLLSKGDMLFLPPTTSRLQRIHGAYVSEDEIRRIVEFLKGQGAPEYDTGLAATPQDVAAVQGDYDEKYEEAVALVAATRQASISMLQRRLRVGYNRSARMIEVMERDGMVGPADGVKPREVYISPETLESYLAKVRGQRAP